MAKKTGKRTAPRLIPLEAISPPVVEPAFISPGPPHLSLLRRVLCPFTVTEFSKGDNYWLIALLNENTDLQYASQYVLEIPKKTKNPWTAQDLAIAAAKRLNEYRGLVSLQEFLDNVCAFSAMFASNSLWTFCLWSTDAIRCPPVKATPDGWKPGEPFPPQLPRRESPYYPPDDCHHPETTDPAKDPKFCKQAQKMFA